MPDADEKPEACEEIDPPVEGLGAFADRTFLDGNLGSWGAVADVAWEPGVIHARAAGEAAVRLARAKKADVRAVPQGSVSSPGVSLFVPWSGGEVTAARVAAAVELPFDARERDLPAIGGEAVRVADAWVFRIDHWSDLLWANLSAMGPFLWARLASPWRLGWAATSRLTLRPEGLAGGLVERGKGAFVHPSATVEFSILGAGARVGAGAVVRGSILGDGAVVEELAMVEGCALGAATRIQRQAMAKYSVIEAGAAHAGVVQLGVIGAGAQVRQGAVLFDQSLGSAVRILRKGRLVEAPRGMIGVCVGPGAVLGQGVRIAAGRAVPAGLTVTADPSQVVSRVDLPAGTRRARLRDGRLEPLE